MHISCSSLVLLSSVLEQKEEEGREEERGRKSNVNELPLRPPFPSLPALYCRLCSYSRTKLFRNKSALCSAPPSPPSSVASNNQSAPHISASLGPACSVSSRSTDGKAAQDGPAQWKGENETRKYRWERKGRERTDLKSRTAPTPPYRQVLDEDSSRPDRTPSPASSTLPQSPAEPTSSPRCERETASPFSLSAAKALRPDTSALEKRGGSQRRRTAAEM